MQTNQQISMQFRGATFDSRLDGERLTSQQKRIECAMLNGEWWTLEKLGQLLNNKNLAGISARVRHLRRMGYEVEHRRSKENVAIWEYRIKTAVTVG